MSNKYLIVEVDEKLLPALRNVIHESGIYVADVPVNPDHSRFYMDHRACAVEAHRRAVAGCREMSEYIRWARLDNNK